ncbi:MAG: aldo/keto reductase [Thermoproteales archaeon]|nr:aldo/keto reductase [Thermoproteales archaeon]
MIEYRRLGRTELRVSIITIGGCAPGFASTLEEATKAFKEAISLGLNVVDIAPTYGKAEDRLGPLIKKYRDKLIITEKTKQRTKKDAWIELNKSLEKLGAKYFDVYQFHAVDTIEDLEKIFSRDGAIHAFIEAKEVGLIKNIGITSHNVQTILKALEKFDFDTVMTPINAGNMIIPRPQNDFRPLLKIAIDRDIGVIAIKAIAKRRWSTSNKRYNTWYEPFDQQDDVDKALWFALSQEPVATYSMACDLKLWPLIIKAAQRFKRLDKKEQEDVIKCFAQKSAMPLFPEDLYSK